LPRDDGGGFAATELNVCVDVIGGSASDNVYLIAIEEILCLALITFVIFRKGKESSGERKNCCVSAKSV
jgi:hypothetical protein